MMRLFRRLRSHDGGASAIEFAFVMPILVGMLIFSVDGWLRLTHIENMADALHAGVRYYQTGGTDDTTAKALAVAAWSDASDDAKVTVSRSCSCGGSEASCSSSCAGVLQTLVTLSAESTFQGLKGQPVALSRKEVLRVQ